MIEQGFNYADTINKEMTDIFETKVDNLEPKKDKKKSSAAAKKSLKKAKKRKRQDSNSSVVESSEERTEASRPSQKSFILHSKCSHFTDSFKDLRALVSKHKQKKKKSFRN